MSSMWNNHIQISIFGESHGSAIGVVMDNLPSGEELDMDKIQAFMARRAPANNKYGTPRKEADIPEIVSGLFMEKTTGTPLCAIIKNTDTRSKDYDNLRTVARPGHADFTGFLRYKGFNDPRGSGHFSGRLTAPFVFAGAVAAQILEKRGIYTGAHIKSILNAKDTAIDPVNITKEDIIAMQSSSFPVINHDAGEEMKKIIDSARLDQNSVGGVIECCTVGMPAGVGSPMFDGLENTLASIIFGIPAVKGLEFGAGFESAELYGTENNDEFYVDQEGNIKTKTNNHGGILGGISTGMPITLNVAFKPTPSISTPQNTVDYTTKTDCEISTKGRHDPCVVVRAVPVVESAVNIALLSQLTGNGFFK